MDDKDILGYEVYLVAMVSLPRDSKALSCRDGERFTLRISISKCGMLINTVG